MLVSTHESSYLFKESQQIERSGYQNQRFMIFFLLFFFSEPWLPFEEGWWLLCRFLSLPSQSPPFSLLFVQHTTLERDWEIKITPDILLFNLPYKIFKFKYIFFSYPFLDFQPYQCGSSFRERREEREEMWGHFEIIKLKAIHERGFLKYSLR